MKVANVGRALITATFSLMTFGFFFASNGWTIQVSRSGTEEVRERFEAFNLAWEQRDMDFVRDYYAQDDDMLLFFERRQLEGWPKVEALYENMFAHASDGVVESTTSNVKVRAVGDMAFVAANFHLQVTDPDGETTTDQGRQSVVFERRDGRWVVVHRHTSFQASPGPQRKVLLHTEPGSLWKPNLEGVWTSNRGGFLIASMSHLTFSGIPELAVPARYRLSGNRVGLNPVGTAPSDFPPFLEEVMLTPTEFSFRIPGKATRWTWTRLE